MSSKLYNPKNQWGKSLVPVATPKSKTGTPDNEFIDPSWLDTVDSLEPTEEKKLVSSDALKEVAEKFEQNQAEHEQFKKDIKQNNLLAGTVAEHLADTKASLEETKKTVADNDAANKAAHAEMQEQITTNNRLAGAVAEHFVQLQETVKETNQKIVDNEVANTNVSAVFDSILKTAIKNNVPQEDIPSTVLIISDMEFDEGAENWDETLFEKISSDYEKAGYKLPKLVFWNVCSRTAAIPMDKNELGLVLVSGFSPNLIKCVMSGQLDPFKALVDVLNSDRYKPVGEKLNNN